MAVKVSNYKNTDIAYTEFVFNWCLSGPTPGWPGPPTDNLSAELQQVQNKQQQKNNYKHCNV